MRIKKIWFFIFLGVVVALALFGTNYLTYERQPLPRASAALESNEAVCVTRTPWLTFTPAGSAPATGFIFYPGGRISYLGYSDLMRAIAEKSYLVVVPKMPLNMAVFDVNIADKIIAAHPEIQHWVIGGHSGVERLPRSIHFHIPGKLTDWPSGHPTWQKVPIFQIWQFP